MRTTPGATQVSKAPATSLADHAFAHAAAVLGDTELAVTVAARGLARGGRSRAAVLGHTRAAALDEARSGRVAPPADPPYASVTDAAVALAATRTPLERAVVDLEGRHGLPRAGFGRALGLPPSLAAGRAAAVAAAWAEELDPALLAWLGAGECEGLAEVLDPLGARPGATDLVAVAPAVAAHADECEACADRRRALVSVRSLVTQAPLPEAAPSLRRIARSSRRRPPLPTPPLERRRPGWVLPAVAGVVALAAAASAAVAGLAFRPGEQPDRGERVEALTELPKGEGALALSRSTFTVSTATVELFNRSTRATAWRVSSTVPWVVAEPDRGRLGAGDSVVVSLSLTDTAPEGDLKAALTFTADDGSTTGLTGAGTVERPPDVAADRTGCDVVATAEDEGSVAAVALHWREGRVERTLAMERSGAASEEHRYTSRLPAGASSWWVTAVDARGNVGRTSEARLGAPAC